MFFNSFTIIILCIQANTVNTNIFETTNHSGQACALSKFVNVKIWHYFKKKIIVSSTYDFSSSHATVFLNSSMMETNRCETHEDYRQWCNLFNNTMYLDWSSVSVVRQASRGHKISNDSPMTSCVPDIKPPYLIFTHTVLAHVPCSRYSPYHARDLTSSGLTWAWPK